MKVHVVIAEKKVLGVFTRRELADAQYNHLRTLYSKLGMHLYKHLSIHYDIELDHNWLLHLDEIWESFK